VVSANDIKNEIGVSAAKRLPVIVFQTCIGLRCGLDWVGVVRVLGFVTMLVISAMINLGPRNPAEARDPEPGQRSRSSSSYAATGTVVYAGLPTEIGELVTFVAYSSM
jgi:hypothetical protein